MLGRRSGLVLDVYRPLKRNVIVGTHSRKTWYRGIYGLEVHEVERVPQRTQFSG